jgi:hypothetical protein
MGGWHGAVVNQFAFILRGVALQFAEKLRSRRAAPKGAIDSEKLTVSLKRYPDTKRAFFSNLFSR